MPLPEMTRKPPVGVRRRLRSEVGFGCPVEGCGNPYLEYHHFDPPWHVMQHHNPKGMIALCATHHGKADAWTAEDCRELKNNPYTSRVAGRFEWMRHEVVAIIGGNYYHETPEMVVYKGTPIIWFERDSQGRLLLSLNMLSATFEPRTQMVTNDWVIGGDPVDVESPPNGSHLRVKYANGDELEIRFKKWATSDEIAKKHPAILRLGDRVQFPLVTAEIRMIIGGTNVWFTAKETSVDEIKLRNNVVSNCKQGLLFN